jgi:hypothetical protein
MGRRCGPPSQGWKTFLRNHASDIAAIDLFVLTTAGFKLLYGLAIIHLGRRRLVWTSVTINPTAEWIARQITEAFPWTRRHVTSSATETAPTASWSKGGFGRWASEIDQPHPARPGRTDT